MTPARPATPAAPVSLTNRVLRAAAAQGITLDAGQLSLLDEVAEYLASPTTSAGWFVYGPAGRGKTWLLTQIVESVDLPASAKRTVHFHTFFTELQRKFKTHISAISAIKATVEDLLEGTELFFFDELHVHEPGGAALLNNLIAELVHRGVPTLFSSNYAPELLLDAPYLHHVVEPSVKLIRDRFRVETLDGGTDYRLAGGNGSRFAGGQWVAGAPLAPELTPPLPHEARDLLEAHRSVTAAAVRDNEVWFDFNALLEVPSTASDFVELAERFDTWVLTDVPSLEQASEPARERFVSLIDVLVHADHELHVFAQCDRETFLTVEEPPADLFRAASRLALLREG